MQNYARDEAGNVWEVDAQGNAVRLVTAAGGGQNTVITKPADPYAGQRNRLDVIQEQGATDRLPFDYRSAQAGASKAEYEAGQKPVQDRFDNTGKLRDQYNNLPAVKNYTAALPAYIAGLRSAPDPAGDLNLIYAYAKIMDPNSVVREGEQASVAGGDSLAGQIEARLKKELGGNGGTFTTEYRHKLRREMAGRMGALNQAFIAERVRYKDLADRGGFSPVDVVGEHPGAPFQRFEEQFLGRPVTQLDYRGEPVGGTSDEGVIGARSYSLSPRNVADFAAGLTGGRYDITEDGGLSYDGQPIEVSAEIINSDPFRQAYRQKFGKELTGVFVDLEAGETPAEMQTRLERERDTGFGEIDAAVRGVADTVSLGLADPLAAAARSAFNDDGFAVNYARERAISRADEAVNPYARLGGQIVGSFPAAVGAARLGAAAIPNRTGVGIVGGEISAGGIYGGFSNPDNPAFGTLVGGTSAFAGQQLGQRVLGPAVGRMFAASPSLAARRAAYSLAGKKAPAVPAQPTSGERMLSNVSEGYGMDGIRNSLEEAQRLGLPMALADVDPRFRTLAGSAVRRSPAAREYAESVLEPRARGQAERAISAIERDFGPVVNMDQTRAGLKGQAQAVSRPFYEQAFSRAAPVDPDINAMLATPAGKQALNRAVSIARNEGRDPNSLGFDVNEAGEVVAISNPSFETLHMVKRGLDSVVEAKRGATGVLNRSDPEIAAIDRLRARFRTRLGELDSNYAAGNAAYAEQMRNRDGLNFGFSAVSPKINPDALNDTLTRFPADAVRTGYRTGMADQVDRARFSTNPYNTIYGTGYQEQKLGALFPETAPRFARQAELERQMAKTNYETLGGAPTAARIAADEQFAPGLGIQSAAEVGTSIVTGMPPMGAIAGAARNAIGDRWRMGLNGSEKAEQIAPILLNPDPGLALQALERLQIQQQLAKRSRRAGGIFGASLGIPFVAGTVE